MTITSTSTSTAGGSGGGVLRGRGRYLLHGAILLGLGVAATRYLGAEAFQAALRDFRWSILPLALLLALGSLALKGVRFTLLQRRLSRVPARTILTAYFAGQACCALPGGIAARAGLLHQAGIPLTHSGPPILASGAVEWAVILAGSLAGALWYAPVRRPLAVCLAILVFTGVGIWLCRRPLARAGERLAARFGLTGTWRGLLAAGRELLQAPVLTPALAIGAADNGLAVGALAVCAGGAGLSPGVLPLLLAFFVPTLLGRVSGIPGGIGVMDWGMVTLLAAGPGEAGPAAAAVAVFRACTLLFDSAIGGIVYLVGWRPRELTRG